MSDLVSIIMPSFNTANYIVDSIKSVLGQTYTFWELIIVDDCSSDNTENVIKPFLVDKRIRFYKNDTNQGAAFCRNKALVESKGKWIAFLDSDDLWSNKKLEKQLLFMQTNNYSFSYTNYREIDSNGTPTNILVTGPKKITRAGFFNYCWPGCLTVMYDSSSIGLIQIENIKKNNDYAMWLKVCKKSDCYLLNEELGFYRKGRVGSISNSGLARLIKSHYIMFRVSEKQNPCVAFFNTCRNILFGFYKKIKYVKKN